MTWVRVDDRLPFNSKVIGLSDEAFRLYMYGLCYANANLSDGAIARAHLPYVWPGIAIADLESCAGELLARALWEPADDGWKIHDYLRFQPSKQHVEEERAKAAERQKRARLKASQQKSRRDSRGLKQRDSRSSSPAGRGGVGLGSPQENVSEEALALAQQRLDEKLARGESVTDPDAWMREVAAREEERAREELAERREKKLKGARAFGRSRAGVDPDDAHAEFARVYDDEPELFAVARDEHAAARGNVQVSA